MSRVKRAVNAHKKRRTVLKRAKGYYGAKSRSYRAAKEQVQHSLQYMYRDRRNKKREIRRLWITRINAAARLNGLSYSVLMNGLKKAVLRRGRGCQEGPVALGCAVLRTAQRVRRCEGP